MAFLRNNGIMMGGITHLLQTFKTLEERNVPGRLRRCFGFMEEETRKIHEKLLKEKKELHARFVAERQAGYGISGLVDFGL